MVHPGLAERQFGSLALPELGEPGQPSPTTPSRQLMEWVATAQRHGRVGAVEEYLAKHHLGSWHTTLNNHASTRPKMYGGPLVPAVSRCKTFEHIAPGSASAAAPGSASAAWRCSLNLPNSFTPTDGRRLQTEGYATTKDEASELACRRAVALLLMMEPSQVVLRPAHWRISPSALLEGLPGTHTVHQALPVHVAPRSLQAGVEAGRLTAAEVNDRVAALLRWCLTAHGGSFDPSRISRAALGQQLGEEAVYSQLNKLLLPGGLRPFVESHPEFSWTTHGQKGMLITWALGAEPAAASNLEQPAPSSASAAAAGLPSPNGQCLGSTLVLLRPHFCPPWPCRGRCRVLHEDGWPCGYPCDLPKNHSTECMCVMHSPPEVDPVCMPCHACARPCQRT